MKKWLDEKMKYKYFWAIVIISLVIFVPLVVNLLLIIPSPKIFSLNNDNAWIGFFGNYSGGIIGGIVAFLIVKIQIKNQKENSEKEIRDIQDKEKNLRIYNQLPSLVKLKFLLEGIVINLNNALTLINSGEIDVGNGKKIIISNQMSLKINPLNINYLDAIEKIMDVNMQIDLIKLTNFYIEFQKIAMVDDQKNQIEFAEVKKELDMKLIIKNKTSAMRDEIEKLNFKLKDIVIELGPSQFLKETLWEKLKKEKYLEKSKLLLEKIEKKIEEVQNIMS